MPSPRKKNHSGFTQEFQKILDISNEQVNALEELETEFFRERMFRNSNRLSDDRLKWKYFRKFSSLLSTKQLEKLKAFRKEKKVKRQNRTVDGAKKRNENRRKRFERLEMNDNTFEKFSSALAEIHEKISEESTQRIKSRDRTTYNRYEDLQLKSKKALAGILSDKQLKLYLDVLEETEKKQLEWSAQAKKNEYQRKGIAISLEQAAEVIDFEKENSNFDENGKFLSEWETMEREKDFLKTILSSEQFAHFMEWQDRRIEKIKADYKNNDASYVGQLEMSESRFQYMVKNYLPVLCERRKAIEELLTNQQKDKIAVLRKVYVEKMIEQLTQSKKDHERFYRGLGTNELKLSELRKRHFMLCPNAWFIRADDRCKEILSKEVSDFLSRPSEALQLATKALEDFNIHNYEAHDGRYGGWIHVVQPKPEEAYLSEVSTLLLYPEIEENISNAALV